MPCALITGCDEGIGRGIATACLADGWEVIATYIDHYHDRPHSRLNYQTPREVRATWDDATGQLQNIAA